MATRRSHPDHLTQIGARWYFKRRIPADVRHAFNDKAVWKHALGTTDAKVAAAEARRWAVKYDDAIQQAREENARKQRLADLEATVAKLPLLDRALVERHDSLGGLQEALEAQRRELPFAEAAVAVLDAGLRGETVHDDVGNAAPIEDAEIAIEEARARLRRLKAQEREKVDVLVKVGLAKAAETPSREPEDVNGLMAIIERWAAEEDASPQHVEQYKYPARRFIELHGDVPVRDITKVQIRELKDHLARLPRSTRSDVRRATILDAIRIADRHNLKRISNGTVQKHISALSFILKFAATWGYVATSPMDGVKILKSRKKTGDRSGRKPFQKEQLETLFRAIWNDYTKYFDEYWIPLISVYQGMRAEEICQLEKSDLYQKDGIWVFDINGQGTKKVKNESSERVVPIHQALINEGLLDHWRRSPGPQLFATLKPDSRGRLAGSYGKRFSRLLRKRAKINDPSLVFHSLRHSWLDACRDAGVPIDVRERLGGWSGTGNPVANKYGEGHSLAVLNQHLQAVQLLGVS